MAKRQKNPVVVVFNANEQGQNARYDDEFGGGLFTGRFLEALSQRVSRGVYSLDAVASLTSRFAFERAKELGLVFRSDGRERSEQTPFFFQFGEGTISFDSKSTDGESTTSRVSLSIGNEPVKSVSTVEVRKLIVAALSAFEREDYSKAKELAESALQRDSDSKSAKRVLNEVAKKLSQVDSVRALIREGWTLYEMDRAEDALSKADEALKLDPASAGAKKLRDLSKKRLDEGLLLANPASPDESRVQNERRSSESDNLVLIEPERYRALRDEPSAGTRKTIAVNGVDFPFRFCPDGSFLMGASENKKVYDNELPQRAVFLSGFWILEVPVTQAMWRAVTSRDAPCSFRGERLPVERVTWRECRDFAEALNELNAAPRGLRFSLPSEAQWEYACRAGWKTEYFWGDSLNGTEANCDGKFPFGSTSKGPFVGKTTEVGSYKSNAWGVFDASGNVWEWCLDWYGEYSKDDVRDPFGPSSGTRRVARGGSWSSRAVACRSGYRNCFAPESRRDNLGFRLALSSAVNREEIGERSKERSSELTTDSSDGPRSVYALTDEPSAIERVAPSKEDAFRARELASKAFEAFEAGNFEEAKRLAETAIFFAPDIGAAKFVLSEAERQLLKR
ncbi:MAG: SUMF1/EgtB/PvdO family nonheme iron enzyme [Thermoguttaceae bacterium]|nr:SUMF1/EgtB/PvdO family nonheme iron enzyme [Thermoguttaceae bacterium]